MASSGEQTFKEKCASYWSTEEWTVLTQEDLPSITKIIGKPDPPNGDPMYLVRLYG
jgi:hypothetical protein